MRAALVWLALPLALSAAGDARPPGWADASAPVDLSFLLDAPAGKHGFLGVDGERFVFEDGTEFRAWGTAVSGAGCFPPPEEAARAAQSLARHGINLVRFMNLNDPDAAVRLFEDGSVTEFNAVVLDRLDYFIQQLANRGIYTWLDLPAPPAEGAGDHAVLHWNTTPRFDFLDRAETLWTHRNRYSPWGRQYRDMPSIAFARLPEDGGRTWPAAMAPGDLAELQRVWNRWRGKQDEPPAASAPWNAAGGDARRFMMDTVRESYRDMRDQMRRESVKTAFCGGGLVQDAAGLAVRGPMDFIAARIPVDGGGLSGAEAGGARYWFEAAAFFNLRGKPLMVCGRADAQSETHPAGGPLWMAAMARFQDWKGCVILPPSGGDLDGAVMDTMPAAALAFHRGGIETAREASVLAVPEPLLPGDEPIGPFNAKPTRLAGQRRMQTVLEAIPSGPRVFLPTEPEILPAADERKREGCLHDEGRGLVLVRGEETECLFGDLAAAREGDLERLRVDGGAERGALAVNALDGGPLGRSGDVLLTYAVGAGDGAETASVRIRTGSERGWTVESLPRGGGAPAELPWQARDGWLSFEVDPRLAAHYRLRRGG